MRRIDRVPSRVVVVAIVGIAAAVGVALLVVTTTGSGDRSSSGPQTAAPGPTTTSLPTTAAPGTGAARPFGPDSFWNRKLPGDVALSPRSEELVRSFNDQWRTFYGTVAINTSDYSVSVYSVPADQPTVPVRIA